MYSYSLLAEVMKAFSNSEKGNLSNIYVFACQHILEPQQKMFSLLVDFGLPKKNIFITGKIYSTSISVLKEMKDQGFQIEQAPFDLKSSFDNQHKDNCANLFEKAKAILKPNAKAIVLDDGGGILSMFNERLAELDPSIQVYGIEQTSSGFRRLEGQDVKFSIINVARSAIKLGKESAFIAQSCIENIRPSLNTFAGASILIVGLGPIGLAAKLLLEDAGFDVHGFDISLGHTNLMAIIKKTKPSFIIGATGSNIMTHDDIEAFKDSDQDVYLVSMSSADREFPVLGFRTDDSVHKDVRAGKVVFVNNGFPVNFKGNRHEGAIEGIERTIGLLLGSVLHCIISKKEDSEGMVGFVGVPAKITRILV